MNDYHNGDNLGLEPTTPMKAGAAPQAQPSDEEILSMIAGNNHPYTEAQFINFARALLSRYGRPAGGAQPAARASSESDPIGFLCPVPGSAAGPVFVPLDRTARNADDLYGWRPVYAAPVAAGDAQPMPADIEATIKKALIFRHDAGEDQDACDNALNWLSQYAARAALNRRLAVDELIERLRAMKWEVIDDDDWDNRCVFVDMRPDDFEALLTEAAAALEAARGDACVALREALKKLITWIPSADTYRRLGFDPEAPMRALKDAKKLVEE